MAKIKVGIVEDEILIAESIINALETHGYEATEPAITYTEALAMIERDRPDILLLDIQLSGKKDGIDVALYIKDRFDIPFIFLTANSDAATVTRAKMANPAAYLVKPFTQEELYASIEVCLHNFASRVSPVPAIEEANYLAKEYLFIKQGQSFQKVKIADILYLESENVYISVHTTTAKYLVRTNIQAFMGLLESPNFFRVHRSYAVNMAHIDSIDNDHVYMHGSQIPVSRAYREELLSLFKIG